MRYLDRALTVCAYYYGLCLSEKDFHAELRRLQVPVHSWPRFVLHDHTNATLHYFENADGRRIAIVCLDMAKTEGKAGIQIAPLLTHEAVYIWQRHAAVIGSFNDHGDEEEAYAYAIQTIAQNLMQSYQEQTNEISKS